MMLEASKTEEYAKWRKAWRNRAPYAVLGTALLLAAVWFPAGPAPRESGSTTHIHTVYKEPYRAAITYVGGVAMLYYAAYVVMSAIKQKLPPDAAAFHLAFWTLVPPAWFFFEWFIWFDNHKSPPAVEALKTAQGLVSNVWGGVLALLLSFKIADAIRNAATVTSRDPSIQVEGAEEKTVP